MEGHPLLNGIQGSSEAVQVDNDTVIIFSSPNNVLRWDLLAMDFKILPNLSVVVPDFFQISGEHGGDNWIFLFGRRIANETR